MREWKKASKKIVSFVLAMCMIIGLVPMNSLAAPGHKGKKTAQVQEQAQVEALAETNSLDAALEKAKTYIDALTINNSQNDPANVVSNYGTHFTWDNEKRESGKSYLYDWSYYNGVVFEGLEYVYEVTGEEVYADYVKEYMSSLIASNGTWEKCTNNSSKECAGYNSTHGADCYKTASLLLDLYERTNDSRYLTMAKTLYADLDSAANKYLLNNAGKNYRHTWASDSTPDLWLDGLYMILPFRAEYAKYSNDTEELKLIVDRMQWVSDNMYDSSKKLFYHAADSANSNSGTFWLRSIGWYAAAIVDIMDSMEGENLAAMKTQLVKLVDGMKACQNTSNGMWLNNLAASQSTKNPYETSGTALICYAVMKAVNEGWLDESYADMAILAFEGICNEKLSGTTLKDICFKGAPGDSNSTFYDNEGKGVGPFIMFYAEVLEYANTEEEPVEPETPVEPEVTVEDTTIKVENVTNLSGKVVTEEDKAVIEEKEYTNFVAFDITATLVEGAKAIVSIPVPTEWNATEDQLVGISVEDGVVKEIKGTLSEDGIYSFEVDHFSAKGVAYSATPAAEEGVYEGTGNLVGGTVYTLDTNGVTANKAYLIVNTKTAGKGYALTNNNGNTKSTEVTITSDGKIVVPDDSDIAWKFSGSTSGNVYNGDHYVYLGNNATLSTNKRTINIRSKGAGAYQLQRADSTSRYLTCSGVGTWQRGAATNLYLYEYDSKGSGAAVTFEVSPKAPVALTPSEVQAFTDKLMVTVAGETKDLSRCTITWTSSDTSAVTVTDGTVTAVADGSATVTATLSAVDGTSLQENIVLTIPVTVNSKQIDSSVEPVLTGNDPVTTKLNVVPDFSNIKLTVTYEDKTTGTITVANGLKIEGYDISKIGYSFATISYAGEEYGTVLIIVEGNPYEGLKPADKYPEYPEDGAVRIDKTASANADVFRNTGVTHVELDVAGITVKPGIDAVLTIDVSNSMYWETNTGVKNFVEYNKLDEVMEAVTKFAEILLADNENGTPTNNTVTIVTFAGYDTENGNPNGGDNGGKLNPIPIDSVRTLVTATSNLEVIKAIAEGTKFTEADKIQFSYVPENQDSNVVSNVLTTNIGTNHGNTNYDYAFWQTEQAITNGNLGDGNRQVHVLFMTDGCASNFNDVYYRTKNIGYYYKPGTSEDYDANTTYQNGTAWTDAILKSIQSNGGNIYARNVYGMVDGMYAIGFDMAYGSFSGIGTWDENVDWEEKFNDIVRKLVTDENGNGLIPVTAASDSYTLNDFYESLAHELILYAGTSAQVTDIVDKDFTLQMAATSGSGEKTATLSNFGITPKITVTTYDLYTKSETNDTTLIGTRKGTSDVLETVTFNAAGTEAYSDQMSNGTENIMTIAKDGTIIIKAHYFTYTKTASGVETFNWTIGNITEKEIVLGFDAYLKGSLEGEREKGVYYTNEEAILEYVDITGKHATQVFPVPAVSWGGGSTTIRFYLVNEKGEPVNRNGEVVPHANRIYVGEPVTVALNLNADATIDAQVIEAAAYVPSEYFLYDIEASYTIQTASGDNNSIVGGIAPSNPSPDAYKTAAGKTQTGAQTTIVIDYEATYYTYSTVGFGVRWDLTSEETDEPLVGDKVVIDYGKAILVDVLANDPVLEEYNRELTGFVVYNEKTNTAVTQHNPGATIYSSSNGSYSIDSQKVRFQLNRMLSEIERVFYVVKYTRKVNTEDFYYLFGKLDIIPATSVYYETDFATNAFTTTTTGTAWVKDKVAEADTTSSDNSQDDGTIGKNQTYGFDSSYENDAYLSNKTSYYVEGQGYDSNKAPKTYTEFSFVGTGFEVISRTGAEQGLIKVEVFKDAKMTEAEKTISVLNKSESNLELYQIPVVSINDLSYGTHYVRISVDASYKNETGIASLDSLNRGNQFFFDAIRVFDPALGNVEAEAAYAMDGEANRQLDEIRALLINKETFDAINETTDGMVFIDRDQSKTAVVATYKAIGPNNETYLANGQAVAFMISADTIPASVDIGAKSITGAEATLKATITNSNGTEIVTTKSIASSTAQNINLLTNATKTNINTIFGSNNVYVVVTNTGDGVLSITDIKVAFSEAAVNVANEIAPTSNDDGIALASETEVPDLYAVSYSVDATTFALARRVLETSDDSENLPEVDEPEVEPNYDILSATVKTSNDKKQKKTVITVETTQDVEELKITEGRKTVKCSSMTYEDKEGGTRVWTVTLSANSNGNKTYTITGYGDDGTQGKSLSVKTSDKKNDKNNKKNK